MPVCYPHQGRCHLRRCKTLGHLIATATAATLGARCRSVRHAWGCGGEQGPRSSCRVAAIVEVHLCHRPVCIGRDGERERERKGRDCRDLYAQWTEKEGASAALGWGVVVPSPLPRPRRPWGTVVSSPPPRARERGWGGRAIFL